MEKLDEQKVREEVTRLLNGDQAHVPFARAVKDFPAGKRGDRPFGVPYSAWQLVEHIRIAQRDILDWSRNSDGSYKPLKWPDDYWPEEAAPRMEDAWDKSVAAVHRECEEMCALVNAGDLTATLSWSDGHTLLREALLLADHTAYHTSEIVVVRRLLGCWKS